MTVKILMGACVSQAAAFGEASFPGASRCPLATAISRGYDRGVGPASRTAAPHQAKKGIDMNGVPFRGGPYDGASFSFSDRLPERVELSVRCCHASTPDPEYHEALIALLGIEPDAPEDAIFVRHADALTARYDQDSTEDGSPWFRYAGWSVQGARQIR
jgi:hypothetical protein